MQTGETNRERIETITFASNKYQIKGFLHHPGSEKPPVVVGSHGLFSDGNSPKQLALAQACNAKGLAFFRFDHRGCGRSGGEFNLVTSLQGRAEDLIDAIQFIQARDDMGDKIGLFGSSFGGAVCIYVAGILEVDALVTVAAPVYIPADHAAAEAVNRSAPPDLAGQGLQMEQISFDLRNHLSGIQNLMIFHGDADEVIPVSHAHTLYDCVNPPKCLSIQQNGDHRMSDPSHQQEFIREASNWLKVGLLGC